MQDTYRTERLTLSRLQPDNAAFIQTLVNTPGWKRFIGERHVHSLQDAHAYVQRLLANQAVNYWVVRLRANEQSIGVVTVIKKDYLDHPDIGFAFLPEWSKQGYAYEAAHTVLSDLLGRPAYAQMLATTVPTTLRRSGY